MPPVIKNPKKVNKGAPSGFVVSLIFHAAVFFVAGLFVVFDDDVCLVGIQLFDLLPV